MKFLIKNNCCNLINRIQIVLNKKKTFFKNNVSINVKTKSNLQLALL